MSSRHRILQRNCESDSNVFRACGRYLVGLSFSIMIAVGPAGDVQAQPASQEPEIVALDRVTVTARRRDEDAQSVPIGVTVLKGHGLEGIATVASNADIARTTPNFNFVDLGGSYSNTANVRGVGSLFPLSPDDASVSFNVDEIPLSAFSVPASTLDLARIEILRGPQGTLYGRGSQAGAVNFVPRRPSARRELAVRGETDADGWGLAEIVVNRPVRQDTLLARAAMQYSHRDGDVSNIVRGGKDGEVRVGAARGSLLWMPNPETSALLTAQYQRNVSTQPLSILRDADCYPCSGLDPRNKSELENGGLSLRIDRESESIRLTILSSVQRTDGNSAMDLTDSVIYGAFGYPASVLNVSGENLMLGRSRETDFFQEMRFSSLDGSRVAWTAGANVFRSEFTTESIGENVASSFAAYSGRQDNALLATNYALFGETSVPMAADVNLIAGARMTREAKEARYRYSGDGIGNTALHHEQDSSYGETLVTGRLGITYELAQAVTSYATVSRGAVAGGFSYFAREVPFGRDDPMFPASTSWAYELGIKSRFWGDHAVVNGSIFHNDVGRGHLLSFDPLIHAHNIVTLDYETHGGEIEGQFQFALGLTVHGAVGFTRARLRNVPENSATGAASGNRVPNVARLNGHIGTDYRFAAERVAIPAGQIFASTSIQYVGSRAADVINSLDLRAYRILNGRIGWDGGEASVYLFGSNLLDERFQATGGWYGPGGEIVRVGIGRTWGLGATVSLR